MLETYTYAPTATPIMVTAVPIDMSVSREMEGTVFIGIKLVLLALGLVPESVQALGLDQQRFRLWRWCDFFYRAQRPA